MGSRHRCSRYAYSLNGSKGLAAKTVEKEVKELSSALEVPVATQDERFTTATAAKELAIQGLDSKQRKVIDQVAASVILQLGWITGLEWRQVTDDNHRTL